MDTEILQHKIEYNWRDGSKNYLSFSDIDHIKKMIEDGYNEGELCQLVGAEGEIFGWWKIIK